MPASARDFVIVEDLSAAFLAVRSAVLDARPAEGIEAGAATARHGILQQSRHSISAILNCFSHPIIRLDVLRVKKTMTLGQISPDSELEPTKRNILGAISRGQIENQILFTKFYQSLNGEEVGPLLGTIHPSGKITRIRRIFAPAPPMARTAARQSFARRSSSHFREMVRLQDRLSSCSDLIFNPFFQPTIFGPHDPGLTELRTHI